MNILILSTGTPSQYLIDVLNERKYKYEVYDPRDLTINVSEQSGYDKIYHSKGDLKTPIRLLATNYDAIISRIGADTMHSVSILRHLNENLGVYCPQNANGILTASDKLWSYQVLSQKRVKTINTYFTRRANHVRYFVEQLGGLPIVGKTPTGSKGKGVFVLDSIMSANSVLGLLHTQDVPVMLQRFVKSATQASGRKVASSEGKRLIVVGDKVVCAMKKINYDHDEFRDNLDRGAKVEGTIAQKHDIDLALRATKALGLEFAGVDIINDADLEHGKDGFVVEVNSNPGTGIIQETGHNFFKDIIELIESKVNKSSDKTESKASEEPEPTSLVDNSILTIQNKHGRGETLSPNEAALLSFATIKDLYTTK